MSGCQWPVTPMDATPVRSWPCTHSHCHCTWAPLAAKVQWRVRGKKKGDPDQQVGKRSPLPGGGGGGGGNLSWVLPGCLFLLGSHQLIISCGSQQTSCYRCLKCRFSRGLWDGLVGIESCHQDRQPEFSTQDLNGGEKDLTPTVVLWPPHAYHGTYIPPSPHTQ